MPHSTAPESRALPDPVLRFAQQGAGLFVFSGPHDGASVAARALAAHAEEATGRQPEHRAPGPLRAASAGPRLIIDDRALMHVDRLLRLVAEAEAGALVVATMDYARAYPDVHLVDVIRLAEDIDYTLAFHRVFYAAAVAQPDGAVLEADVHMGRYQRR